LDEFQIKGIYVDSKVEVQDYISVRDRAVELGCEAPRHIAILPVDFATATSATGMLQRSEAGTIRTLFRTNEIVLDELVPKEARGGYVQNNSFEWIAPTLFISGSLWSQDPAAVNLALNVLATYLTDFFKGMPGRKAAKLELVVEKKAGKTCKKLTYEGDVSGLRDLAATIERLADE
jgi:hypothetical protein